MIRSRLVCLKHICFAFLTLALLVCALEVGLHLHLIFREQPWNGGKPADQLLVKSWLTYQSLKPSQTVTTHNPDTQSSVQVVTNSFGLRGSEILVPKPPGVFRIICLGDESTLASEIEEPNTFCSLLQGYLQEHSQFKVEVVNAGVPDYCPLLSYLQVKHSLLGLQPDLLILNFDMSDIADDHKCRRHTLIGSDFEPLSCPHPDLIKTKKQPHQTRIIDRFFITKWCKGQLGSIVPVSNLSEDHRDIDSRLGRYAWLQDEPPDWSIYIQQAFSPIGKLKLLTDRAFVRFVVSTYPAPWQVSPTAGSGVRAALGIPEGTLYRSRLPFSMLGDYLQRRDVPFCDTSPAFQNSANAGRLYFKNAVQLSEEGHELYARELAEYVRKTVSDIWVEGIYEQNQQPLLKEAGTSNPFSEGVQR
ncbi:MAG: SGNH/GDSL hydrolase family protein [Planctomycetes bacterium]|nr:SGNH/GDSL hydrolase family protein [Planctomycetota bacterium]